jgi:hypothetical protein
VMGLTVSATILAVVSMALAAPAGVATARRSRWRASDFRESP